MNRHDVVVRVEVGDEGHVGDPVAAGVAPPDAVTVEVHADALAEAGVPVLGFHRVARRRQPHHVRQGFVLTAPDRTAVEVPGPSEGRVVVPELEQVGGELDEVLVRGLPVDPADGGVLRVDVVVARLRASELVAVRDHRHALAQQQRREEVPLPLGAQGVHRRVVRRPLGPGVPRAVVALAVVVVLAVGLVVLLVVGDQVVQREAVVRGDEVDAGLGGAAVVLVQVGRARDARRELAERRGLAAPEVAHGVAVLAVPLGPLRGEVADLVATGADVPRLGDELHLRHDRVLLDQFEEGRQPVDLVELAGECGRQVEAEAVDVHLGHPVAQGVHDELQRVRVADVERVAGARHVHVVPLVVVHQTVVGGVVDAAERQRRAEVVALGGVVVDDVDDDLDAGAVQLAHHRLELLHLLATVARGRVVRVRCEEADGVVAPVVRQPLVLQGRVVDELVHGHELEGGDAQALQVLDDRRVTHAGVRAALVFRDVGVGLGEALDVRFVDDGLAVRDARGTVALPVEERVDHHALDHVRGRVLVVGRVGVTERVREQRLVPVDVATGGLGVGVEQQLGRVAARAGRGVVRAVDAEPVELSGADVRQVGVPDVGVDLDERDALLGAVVVEEAELHAFGHLAEDREVRPTAVVRRAERVGVAGPGVQTSLQVSR